MARWLAEPIVVAPKVNFCGSLRTRSKRSFKLFAGTLGVVLTMSGPSHSSIRGVKSFTTS
jgi:hypothetical protein